MLYQILPFAQLSDIQLIDEITVTNSLTCLTISQFENMIFNPPIINDNFDPLNTCDPDENLLSDLHVMPPSNHYHQSELKAVLDSTETGLSIMFHNIRSIPNNLESFFIQHLVSVQSNLQIIGLSETRLTDDIEHMYTISGFNLFTTNRNRQGGGVALYIKQNIKCKIISDMCMKTDTFESVFVEYIVDSRPETVGVIYRRPNSDISSFIELLADLLNIIKSTKNICHIIGDFNIDLLKYESSKYVQNFVNTFYGHGFHPCTNKPTRVSSCSASIIDHIWSNDLNINRINGILLTDISDHFAPFTCRKKVQQSVNIPVTITYRDYKKKQQR